MPEKIFMRNSFEFLKSISPSSHHAHKLQSLRYELYKFTSRDCVRGPTKLLRCKTMIERRWWHYPGNYDRERVRRQLAQPSAASLFIIIWHFAPFYVFTLKVSAWLTIRLSAGPLNACATLLFNNLHTFILKSVSEILLANRPSIIPVTGCNYLFQSLNIQSIFLL